VSLRGLAYADRDRLESERQRCLADMKMVEDEVEGRGGGWALGTVLLPKQKAWQRHNMSVRVMHGNLVTVCMRPEVYEAFLFSS
jgi:hypothetical protein